MITLKQWSDFKKYKKYRETLEHKIRHSKEWKKAEKKESEIRKQWHDAIKKTKWYERFTGGFYYQSKLELALFQFDILLARVPDNTVEDCLDWLLKQKKKGKKL